MEKKFLKKTAAAVFLTSSILTFSPTAYGEAKNIQQSIDMVKSDMKKAATAYVYPALDGELVPSSALYAILNDVKRNFEQAKKDILASKISDKNQKIAELEDLYQEKINKGLVPYIDAYNYASKYLDPLLANIKEAEAKNDFAAVEKAYHALSYQLKGRTSILYRFSGKASRDLLLNKYKQPANEKRDELVIPVTIYMKITEANKLTGEGKLEEAKKVLEGITELIDKLPDGSKNSFIKALVEEVNEVREESGLSPVAAPGLPVVPVIPVVPSPVIPPVYGGGGGGSTAPSETAAERTLRLAKVEAVSSLNIYKQTDYSSDNWTLLVTYKHAGVIAINSAKSVDAVNEALGNVIAKIASVKTITIENSEEHIRFVTNAVEEAELKLNYGYLFTAEWLVEELNEGELKTSLINRLKELRAKMDSIDKENALAHEKFNAVVVIKQYKSGYDYTPSNWNEIKNIIDRAEVAINEANSVEDVKSSLEIWKLELDKVNTILVERDVATLLDLEKALTIGTVKIINITEDISTTRPVEVNREVTINGNGNKLSFTGLESIGATTDDGLIIYKDSTINNLVVDAGLSDPKAWVGTYGIHVYDTTATLNDVTVTNGNGGVLINGSKVTLTGGIDVSGNGFGGIEVSKDTLTSEPSLDVTSANFTNSTEAYGLPTIWEDKVTDKVTGFTGTKVMKGTQPQYYLEKTNSIDMTTIANAANLNELKLALLDTKIKTINITESFVSAEPILVNREVTINGNGKTLSFKGLESIGTKTDDGLIIYKESTINNLVVDAGLSDPETWVGTYGIHVYNTKSTLKDVSVTNGNGGILINGSAVTLSGIIDVSGNGFGGIEVSKGADLSESSLILNGSIYNITEKYAQPTLWLVKGQGTVTGLGEFSENDSVNLEQVQYYLDLSNTNLTF